MEIPERLSKILIKAYNEDMSSNDLYKEIIRDKRTEDIVGNWNQFLYTTALYRYYLHSDIQDLIKGELPVKIPKGLNYGQFKKELGIYKLYVHQNSVIENDTYYDWLFRGICFGKNRTGFTSENDWLFLNKNLLDKTEKQDEPHDYKIYIPVANKDLERFALMLLIKCMNNNVDYDFKCNNDRFSVRCDNVVIYANKNNVGKYIEMINKVLEENPDITINKDMINPFGLTLNGNYSIAKYLDQGSESYSSLMCAAILDIKSKSNTQEEFIQNVSELLNKAYTSFERALTSDGIIEGANKVVSSKPSSYNTQQEDKKTRQLV
jgi:hypothetical protein